MTTSNERAILEQLAQSAMNRTLVENREASLIEEEKARKLLEREKTELLAKINGTDYSTPSLAENEKVSENSINVLITLYDEQLVSLDTNLNRINTVISTNIDELCHIESRIVELKKEWETLSHKSDGYAEDPVVIAGKKRPIAIIDERRDEIEQELDTLRRERNNTLALLRELVKARIDNMKARKVLERKLVTASENKQRLGLKKEKTNYQDKTQKAIDEATLAVIEMGIKRRNEAIENLRVRPDKLLKKCLEALENGSPEYESLKAGLESLTKIRTVPKVPSNPKSTYSRKLSSPSKLSLEETITSNTKAVDDLLINLVSLEKEEIELLNSVMEKIYLQVKNRVSLEEIELKAAADPEKESLTKRSEENVKVLETQILATEQELVNIGVTISESKQTKMAYEEAISRDQTELFLVTSCRDINAMTYTELTDIIMAKHLSEGTKSKEEEFSFVDTSPSYEEILDSAREVYDIGQTHDFLADEPLKDDTLVVEEPKIEPEQDTIVFAPASEDHDLAHSDSIKEIDFAKEGTEVELEPLSAIPELLDDPTEEEVVNSTLQPAPGYIADTHEVVDIKDKLAEMAEQAHDDIEIDDTLAIPIVNPLPTGAMKVDVSKTKKVSVSPEMMQVVLDGVRKVEQQVLGGK